MKFLLLGANFINKGAQAMLFTATSELRKRFPNAEILYLANEKETGEYVFRRFYDSFGWQYLKGGKASAKAVARVLYRKARGKKASLREMKAFIEEIRTVDAFVDISGYALSSQRGEARSISYLDQIKIARKLGIPYFIMPQSIGPFRYKNHAEQMDGLLREYLRYPVVIFPREEDGYRILVEDFQLTNVRKSYDLVLQNRGVDLTDIYRTKTDLDFPDIKDNAVAIIPNMRNFEYRSGETIVGLYTKIIAELLRLNKNVYLLRHSAEDLEACEMIYRALEDKTNVTLLGDDLNCIQFNEAISHFDYVIASRYHSIVHSYKNAVPAIVLGWAEKYHELLRLFGQERFMFDVRSELEEESIRKAIRDMDQNFRKEHQLIAERLPEYQRENCFDAISEYFRKNGENEAKQMEIE